MSAKSICPARVVLFGTVDYQAGRSSGFLCEQPQLYDDTHPGPGYPSLTARMGPLLGIVIFGAAAAHHIRLGVACKIHATD